MRFAAALLAALACICGALAQSSQTSTPPAPAKKTAKKTTKRARRPAVAPVSPAQRAAARKEIEEKVSALPAGFENEAALAKYFAALHQAQATGAPIHILQFGDSHTASDDWVSAMRALAQARYGDGGPGFVTAGHPYRGYRRFDASGTNSPGWKTQGTMALRGDEFQGLGGLSLSTQLPNQTISLAASGELLSIFYLQQPGGGEVRVTVDGEASGTISTDGETGPGHFELELPPGQHQLVLKTLHYAPVRLFGWTLDNRQGITFETLGINGAQAHVLLGWNEQVWADELTRRAPALVIVAYGTNEANSHLFTQDQYRSDLTSVIERIKHAAPEASILMIGPPDCGRLKPLLHLDEVVDIQREIAIGEGAAFWDWRQHMGGAGMVKRWVTAGLAQTDYIHLTAEGYRMLGQYLFAQLENAAGNATE
ncbi:MAG TPA: GDSL-type esterase/lipase family protein [Bryobacteraceae bacterium]|nr:GDSL-type esterase/lipase family protein [Bryobacteraceae bacterium]